MQTTTTNFLLVALLFLGVCTVKTNAQKFKKRPNIVVILTDDVGFEEYGIYKVKKGEKSNTPIVDRLGEEGVAFKTAYAQSICGPSRAMLYSGTYAATNGAYDNKVYYDPTKKGNDKDKYANFIRVLHDAGYKTAVSGKWHNPIGGTLGVDNALLGVDQYMVYNSQPQSVKKITGDVLTPDENWEIAAISKQPILSRYWKPAYVKDGKVLKTSMKDYGPDLLSDYICDFIKDNAKSEQPFLAFYPMVLAHSSHCVTPIDVAEGMEKSNKHYKHSSEIGTKIFKNQIKYADNLVEKILKTLKEQEIEDNTIVIFTSDNGTTSSAKSKGVEYGVHIPFMVKGPGIKKRGLTDELIDFSDVLPTLAEFAGTTVPSKYKVDGKSVVPFLTGKSDKTKETIYAQPGLASIVRTKEYLLEAVCPLFDHPKGRFYKTNGSYDGRGYENITNNTGYTNQRTAFDDYLEFMSSKLPTSFEDPLWNGKLKRGFKHFNTKQQRRSHLRLPLKYQFYDPSF